MTLFWLLKPTGLHSIQTTLALKTWPTTKKVDKFQPRSEGSLLPDLRSERERPWKTLVTCLPKSGRLQTNDLGEGQVTVRFVSTERRQVSAAVKLCTWTDLERRQQCTKSFDSKNVTSCRISGCWWDVYQWCFHLAHAMEIAEDSPFVQSKVI